MTGDPTRPLMSAFQAHAELELLELILHDDSPYPWNPSELAADAYFTQLEQELVAAGWTTEAYASHGQALAATLEHAWATVEPAIAAAPSAASTLNADLFQQFAAQVPQAFLDSIVQKARQLISTNLSMADQLVACVKDAMPNWGEEDLLVMARPFAYAMRGSETDMLEAALRSVRCAAWTELSGIEQARLSLAIARYAIAQAPAQSHEHP